MRGGRAAGTPPARDPTPPRDLPAGRDRAARGVWGRGGLQLSSRRPGWGLRAGYVLCAEWSRGDPVAREESSSAPPPPTLARVCFTD